MLAPDPRPADRDLDEMFRDAVLTTQHEAAAQLGELIARINGWIIERQVVRVVRSETDVSDEERGTRLATYGNTSH